MTEKFQKINIDIEFTEILDKMISLVNKNKNKGKGKRAFANVALIFDDNFNEICSTNNLKYDKVKFKNKKYETHAEFILIKMLRYENCIDKIIIISLPPCHHCYQRIIKGKFKKIYFITNYEQEHKLEKYNNKLIPMMVKSLNSEITKKIKFIEKISNYSIKNSKELREKE